MSTSRLACHTKLPIGAFIYMGIASGVAQSRTASEPVAPHTEVSERHDDPLIALVERLFADCHRRIGRYLVQFLGDRELAADLLQDCFHDALKSRRQLEESSNQEAWLFGIARNRALRALRRRERFERAIRRLGDTRRDAIADDEEIIAIYSLLERTLSPQDRALVLLRYLHDFDATELAEMTNLSADAVRQRLSRAAARVRAEIENIEKTRC